VLTPPFWGRDFSAEQFPDGIACRWPPACAPPPWRSAVLLSQCVAFERAPCSPCCNVLMLWLWVQEISAIEAKSAKQDAKKDATIVLLRGEVTNLEKVPGLSRFEKLRVRSGTPVYSKQYPGAASVGKSNWRGCDLGSFLLALTLEV